MQDILYIVKNSGVFFSSQVFDGCVYHNAPHPTLERTQEFERRQAPEHFYESILHHILGLFAVLGVTHAHKEHLACIQLVQFLLVLALARKAAFHYFFFGAQVY